MQHSNLWANGFSGQDFKLSRATVPAPQASLGRKCRGVIRVAVAA
jgi:hypothetical protein